jgi:RecB family exonuclease
LFAVAAVAVCVDLQGTLSTRQQQLLQEFGQLEQQQKQQAEQAAAAWQQLAADAAALEERQVRYESLQVGCVVEAVPNTLQESTMEAVFLQSLTSARRASCH